MQLIAPKEKAVKTADVVARRTRIPAVDLTKGALVLLMVAYHSLNYSADYTLGFKYLPFLPPSFIFISGFLIGVAYTDTERSRGGVFLRLISRGLRLLILFTILNVVAQSVGRPRAGLQAAPGPGYFFDHAFEVYVSGENHFAVFNVLVPIAYLLMSAPLIILVSRSHKAIAWLLVAAFVIGSEWLIRSNIDAGLLPLYTAGLIGFAVAQTPVSRLSAVGSLPLISVGLYLAFLFSQRYLPDIPSVQLAHSFLAVMLIFSVSLRVGDAGWLQRRIIALGKYSLLSYIAQIILLQLLVRALGRWAPFSIPFFVQALAVTVALVLLVEALHWARGKARLIDLSYKAVFA